MLIREKSEEYEDKKELDGVKETEEDPR